MVRHFAPLLTTFILLITALVPIAQAEPHLDDIAFENTRHSLVKEADDHLFMAAVSNDPTEVQASLLKAQKLLESALPELQGEELSEARDTLSYITKELKHLSASDQRPEDASFAAKLHKAE